MYEVDPKVLDRIGGYALFSRTVVEGFISGIHRSMFQGFGSEFVQYRNYVPGDDLKYLDWKVYARSRQLCSKVFREETNMNCRVILDCSASMSYQGENSGFSKLQYATMVASCLSYLISKQGDKVGLYAYANEIISAVKPASGQKHLQYIFAEMKKLKATGTGDHQACLNKISESFKGRGLVIFISDMMEGEDQVMRFLKSARFSHNDCILLQVLDNDEIEFPFDKNVRFIGMEDNQELVTAPELVREHYKANLSSHLEAIRTECLKNQFDYTLVNTSDPIEFVLSSYLHKREEVR
ncbi:MAG: DUF58 domain-containing protein [Lentisphaeraceae bacterium]|nr:DUF58 domain-containing protein [Lentisphaeraceae bacterium]